MFSSMILTLCVLVDYSHCNKYNMDECFHYIFSGVIGRELPTKCTSVNENLSILANSASPDEIPRFVHCICVFTACQSTPSEAISI